jgi:hypothetical protein
MFQPDYVVDVLSRAVAVVREHANVAGVALGVAS